MKIRYGMISNSSSTSFVVRLSDFSEAEQQSIDRLVDRSDDYSRLTGVIWQIDDWLQLFEKEGYDEKEMNSYLHAAELREMLKEYPDLVILRESDEQMGGEFSDYGLSYKEIGSKAKMEFEYH